MTGGTLAFFKRLMVNIPSLFKVSGLMALVAETAFFLRCLKRILGRRGIMAFFTFTPGSNRMDACLQQRGLY
jgi:hypothetical protein